MAERSEVAEEQAVRDGSAVYSVEADIATAEDVPPGYKRTEVGVIPGDWQALPAREIGAFKGGSGFPLKAQGDNAGEYPFFKVSDMNIEGNETFMTTANHYISEETRRRLGATCFPRDSIVFAKVGAAVFLERKKILGQPSCIDNNMAAFVLDKNRSDVRYMHSLLLSKKLGNLVSTTALPALNGKQLGEMVLAVPSLSEQRAIATALSDADALIESLDRLIAKKRAIKHATMQQLLTGQTRLPGFTGEWETKRLAELGTCYRGVSYDPDIDLFGYESEATIRLLRSDSVQSGALRMNGSYFVSEDRVSEKQILRPGDIVICMANGSRDLVGKAAGFASQDQARYTIGAFMARLAVIDSVADKRFVGFLLQSAVYRRFIETMLAGSSINNLKPEDIENAEFKVPSIGEQEAVASVLSDMDTEIEALERRRDKARQIKQGMMQQLLTGRVRLVTPEVAA